jgi:hypothetical protein
MCGSSLMGVDRIGGADRLLQCWLPVGERGLLPPLWPREIPAGQAMSSVAASPKVFRPNRTCFSTGQDENVIIGKR